MVEAGAISFLDRLCKYLHFQVADTAPALVIDSDGRTDGRMDRRDPDMRSLERVDQCRAHAVTHGQGKRLHGAWPSVLSHGRWLVHRDTGKRRVRKDDVERVLLDLREIGAGILGRHAFESLVPVLEPP